MSSHFFLPVIAETVSSIFSWMTTTEARVENNNLFEELTSYQMANETDREPLRSRSNSSESDIQELVRDVFLRVSAVRASILDNREEGNAMETVPNEFRVIENLVNFQCPMCDEICLPNCGLVLYRCLHSFCRSCLRLKVKYSEGTEVKCSLQNGDETCENILLEPEIKSVLEPEEFHEYTRRKILEIENAFFCGTPNCMGWCILEDGIEKFYCPICHNYNCFQCDNISDVAECPFCADLNGLLENAPVLEYNALYQLYLDDTVSNIGKFQCPVCLTDFETGEGITLKECLHNFCQPCLINAVEFSADPAVKCPFGDGVVSCENVLSQREVKALVSPELFDKYLARSLTTAEHQMGKDAFHCKTPDCTGWGIKDSLVLQFQCDVCKKINCVRCEDIHDGATCDDYQRTKHIKETDAPTNAILQHMFASNTAMACPKCNIIITKIDGCDGMTCSVCKTAICWATKGPRWGPRGVGDTSGGCRCNVNGVKCHASCGNCH